MSFEDDLSAVEEHVAEARRMVQRQKGLIVRLGAAGVSTLDAQRILWLLESNLRRLENHRDFLANLSSTSDELAHLVKALAVPFISAAVARGADDYAL